MKFVNVVGVTQQGERLPPVQFTLQPRFITNQFELSIYGAVDAVTVCQAVIKILASFV